MSVFEPEHRARRYLKLSFDEYRAAIRSNPYNDKLIDEYVKILTAVEGEIPAKVELALLLQQAGLHDRSNTLLVDIALKDREAATGYIDGLIESSMGPYERAERYRLALKLSPGNGEYWYRLGKLHIGMNKLAEGAAALEKAYLNEIRDEALFYYLSSALIELGEYSEAERYIKEALEMDEKVEFRRLLYTVYRRQHLPELASNERAKIRRLTAKRPAVESTGPELAMVEKEEIIPLIPGISPYIFLFVSKKDNLLHVYEFNGREFKSVMQVVCTTGKNEGPKLNEGDKKTPEGTYLLQYEIDSRTLSPQFGIRAFALNYPNPIDRRLQRDGSGIWLHATSIDEPPYHSQGCVVVNDYDMAKIMEYITVSRTHIHIAPGEFGFGEEEMLSIMDTLNRWKSGWESLDIDKYMALYDEMFYSGGMDKSQYREDKRRINRNKRYINVSLSQIQLLPYGETPFGRLALAFFHQNYRSSNFNSRVYKTLYLVERENGWKIIGEVTM